MPIIRRDDEQRDPLDKYVLMIWKRRWLVVGVALGAGILTYILLLFSPDTFRVKSELFVNRIAAATDQETPNPETVGSLLKSQAVLEMVRNDFVKAFDIKEVPPIETFVKQFEVKSTILQDTTVQKQYSPVLSLTVDATGSSETRYLMERWIRNAIVQYGNYTTQEAVAKRDAFLEEKKRLESEIAEIEVKRAKYDSELPYLKRVLAEKLELLTPSRLMFQDQDVDTIKLDFSIQNPRMRPGLLERYTELQLQMEAGTAPSTAPAEMAATKAAIEDAQTSITAAEIALANARYLQLQTVRHLQQLTANQSAVNEAVSRFTVAAANYKTDVNGLIPQGGDLRALSVPVMPETRIWPKRTLTAALVTVLAGIMTILWLFSRNFLTKLSGSIRQ